MEDSSKKTSEEEEKAVIASEQKLKEIREKLLDFLTQQAQELNMGY